MSDFKSIKIKLYDLSIGNLDKSFEDIKSELITGYENNFNNVIFLGKEPTKHDDILKILFLSKKIGYKTISLETNALACFDESFARKLVIAGLNSVSVLIQTHNPNINTNLGLNYYSLDKALIGLKNLIKYCSDVSTNTIITSYNYKYLEDIMKLLIPLKLNHVLITYPNDCDKLKIADSEIPSLSECFNYIHKGINVIADSKLIRIRNVPYCFMQGYEKYNDVLGFEKQKHNSENAIANDNNSCLCHDSKFDNTYVKSDVCLDCKYDFICPGIDSSYSKNHDLKELKAISGKKISPIMITNMINSGETEIKPLKRVELNVGLLCNNDCLFCISGDKDVKLDSTKNIISEIDKYAGTDVDLLNILGGEPTLLKDLPYIVGYARQHHFKDIQIISNGRRLSDYDFTKRLIGNGLNRISVTIHGHTPELQDKIVQRKNSFVETTQGIENVIELRRKMRRKVKLTCGTCVNKLNYKNLVDIARLVIEKGVDEYLLINLNPNGNCVKYFDEIIPEYKDIIPYIKEVSDYCKSQNIRLSFDGFAHCIIHEFADCLEEDYEQVDEASVRFSNDTDKRDKFNWIEKRGSMKTKIDVCKNCRFDGRCEGIWTSYVEHFGTDDFKAIK